MPLGMTNLTSIDLAYAITLRQFRASLIALGIRTVETIRSWPAPERLVGQTIASMPANGGPPTGRFHRTGAAGQPERGLAQDHTVRDRAGPTTLAGMARVRYVDPLTDHAGHDLNTEIGCAVGLAPTPMVSMFRLIPGAIAAGAAGCGSSKSWLWFLGDMKPLPEALPAVGHQSFRYWDTYGG